MTLLKCVLKDKTALCAMVLALLGCVVSFLFAGWEIDKGTMMLLQIVCFMFSISQVSAFGRRVTELQHELDRKAMQKRGKK